MERITILFQKVFADAVMPTYYTEYDAGLDVYACLPDGPVMIKPQETVAIGIGLKLGIPKGWAVLVLPRSGMSLNTPLRVANSPGLIDCGYKNEVKVILHNSATDTELKFGEATPSKNHIIKHGDKIAQLVPIIAHQINLVEGNIMLTSEDRGGGLGSSDKIKPYTSCATLQKAISIN